MAKQEKKTEGFDPDAYVSSFDPDAYVADAITSPEAYKKTGRGLLKGALEALPVAGGLAGAFAGGGIGSIPLGVAGAAAGKALENLGERYLLDEPKTRSQIYIEPGLAAGEQYFGEKLAGPVVAGAKGLLDLLKTGEKPTAEAIKQATKRIGAEATPGMLSDSRIVQGMQSSLEQSPTIGGAIMRRETEPVYAATKQAAEGLLPTSGRLPSEVGKEAKEGLLRGISERAATAGSYFEDIAASTEFMPIADKSKKTVISNMQRIKGAGLGGETSSAVNRWSSMIENAKTVDDLKTIATEAGAIANDRTKSAIERSVAGETIDKLRRLEQSSIMRSSLANAMTKKEGEQIAKELISDFKSGRKQYAELMKDVKQVSAGSGIGDKMRGLSWFSSKLKDIPDEQIVEKLIKPQNYEYMTKLKSMAPDAFESMRSIYVDNIRSKSLTGGVSGDTISPRKLLSNIEKLEPKTRDLLFGKNANQILTDLKTVVNALPEKVGQSGTQQAQEYQQVLNFINPVFYAKEAARLAQYGLLKSTDIPGGLLAKQGFAPTVEMLSKGMLRPNFTTYNRER